MNGTKDRKTKCLERAARGDGNVPKQESKKEKKLKEALRKSMVCFLMW